jgi:hypothetical protein
MPLICKFDMVTFRKLYCRLHESVMCVHEVSKWRSVKRRIPIDKTSVVGRRNQPYIE